jgi:hypothetical protein
MESKQPNGNIIVNNHCPYCDKDYLMSKRSFANHMKYCDCNPKVIENLKLYGSKIAKKTKDILSEKNRLYALKTKGELKDFEVICCKCGKHFNVKEREFEFPKKENYYCSRNCANSHNVSEETKNKISKSVVNTFIQKGINAIGKTEKICPVCKKHFLSSKKNECCCSLSCAAKYKQIKRYNAITNDIELAKFKYNIYRKRCCFKFSLNTYPEEFDFSLIIANGWYKAANHGNNLKGVSRDHIFSVSNAVQQGIDPYYISHPANCKLLLQSENASKSDNSLITIYELINKVNDWNKKYGEYPNNIDYNFIEDIIKIRY